MSIRLIVGLGNPGPEYEQTRHNAGFWLVDQFPVSLQRDKNFNALVGKTRIAGNEVWLLEPQTFMNRSGQSVGALCRFYKINPDEVLVVHDELDIMPGIAKLKKGGSSGVYVSVSAIHGRSIYNKALPILCCIVPVKKSSHSLMRRLPKAWIFCPCLPKESFQKQ